MTTYHVAITGSDTGIGSSELPWRTITFSSSQLKPGDVLVVQPGTYREQIWFAASGTARAPITLRAGTPGEARLAPPEGAYSTLNLRANYLVIEGFDIVGGSGHGIDIEGAHHIAIRGNIVHDSGGSGISSAKSDWISIERNEVRGNAATNEYQTSGISLWQNLDLAEGPDGFRNIIRANTVHGNAQSAALTWEHTDGNGIIIDGFHDTDYTHKTLIEGNLVYDNGGKGIHVFLSDHVTVRNNTVWHNNYDPLNPGTWRGELSNAQASHNTWVNNIAVADPSTNGWNRAINNVSTNGYINQGVGWYSNLTFDGVAGQVSLMSDYDTPRAEENLLGLDPGFLDPPSNFRLAAHSPALDAGTMRAGAALADLDGHQRVVGGIDLGAFEAGSRAGLDQAPATGPRDFGPDADLRTVTFGPAAPDFPSFYLITQDTAIRSQIEGTKGYACAIVIEDAALNTCPATAAHFAF